MALKHKTFFLALFCFFSSSSYGGEADVIDAHVECSKNFCRFTVTIQHEDEGWEHYVNRFEILNLEKNRILGHRRLRHPHVKEQPFTRTASVLFHEPIAEVVIRAYDTVHEYGGKEMILNVPMELP